MIRFSCQQCGKKFKAPADLAGRVVSCSACGTKVTIPYPEFESSPADARTDAEESKPFSLDMPKRPVFEDLVDMTAMVDIVFFLLIFFMVTSMQGLYSALSIPPPNPEKAAAKAKRSASDYENDTDYVVVRIDRDNVITIDGDKVPSEQELRIKLRAAREGTKSAAPMKKLMVLGNGEAHTVSVVKVIDAGNDAGMDEVQLALDDES